MSENIDTEGQSTDRLALAAVFASVASTGIAWGTLTPLLTVLMERDGVPASLIGLNSAAPVLAVLIAARLLPTVSRRIGVAGALFGGLASTVVAIMLMAYLRSYEAWLAIRFVLGITGSVHWILSETWINTLSPPNRRGLFVGIYGALFMAGFALGPLMLTAIPIEGALPFALVALATAAAGLPLYLLRHRLPRLDDRPQKASLAPLLTTPTVFLGVLTSGLADSALWALLTVYGIQKGLGETPALELLAALNIGTVALQIPLGWIADRIGARPMLLLCGAVGTAGGLALPFAMDDWPVALVWSLVFIWGAMLAALYTVALVELGRRFSGAALAEANAVFVSGYSLGGLVGPLVAGFAMDGRGPDALPGYVAVVTGAYLVFAVVRTLQRRHRRET
ncbi:MAG: MFS transporter [Hyphomicrobiaceae bacterium]